MPLHPDVQNYFAQRAAQGVRNPEDLTVEQARTQAAWLNQVPEDKKEPVARVRDIEIPAPHGAIPARLYYPNDKSNLPILVFFHGGGFVMGNLENTDAVCRSWTNLSQCLIVSVNYRHAPEDKFPAAPEDCYTATKWVSEHASEIDGDASRLAVGGMSAGGGLAAAVTQMARERGEPPIKFQLLWVPVLNYDFTTRSYETNANGYGLTRAGMQWFWRHYLQDPADGANPMASPLRATDFSNLPPAIVVAAEYDPLQDEGRAYAEKLKAAGVPVQFNCYEGMVHGFIESKAHRTACHAMRDALGEA